MHVRLASRPAQALPKKFSAIIFLKEPSKYQKTAVLLPYLCALYYGVNRILRGPVCDPQNIGDSEKRNIF